MKAQLRNRALSGLLAAATAATGSLGLMSATAGASGASAASGATSNRFGGYTISATSIQSGSVRFTVPSEKCTGQASGLLTGVVDPNKMIVTVGTECDLNSTTLTTSFYVYIGTHRRYVTTGIKPGDEVVTWFTVSGKLVTGEVNDITTHKIVKLTAGTTLNSTIQYGPGYLAEPGIRKVQPGPFGSIAFTNALFNLSSLANASPTAV
ncbi:MAG TPA: hypothetical protein VGS21_07690, partial [Acidimicrobiales bacterium]|nr:hypothetical protein [Acidimicrobiales bacterium]